MNKPQSSKAIQLEQFLISFPEHTCANLFSYSNTHSNNAWHLFYLTNNVSAITSILISSYREISSVDQIEKNNEILKGSGEKNIEIFY